MAIKGLIMPTLGPFSGAAGPFSDAATTSTALARVANRPIVCHVLEAMLQARVTEVALLVSASASAELRECVAADGPAGLDVEYVTYEDGAFERALASVAGFVADSPCVVHAANGLLAQPLAPLLGTLDDGGRDLVALMHHQPVASGSIGLMARRMLRLTGVREEERALDLAGACLFGPGALRDAIEIRAWRCGELDLVAIAERLVDEGAGVSVERVNGWHSYTGEATDLLECNRIAFDALSREPVEIAMATNGMGAGGNRIEGYVQVHSTACVRSSVIVGPATLGPGAQVVDSYIGPYTSIGADVRIEGAEVERSIILRGASITHIGGRLVGSVVGREARVFRDFSLPRALRVNVGDGGEVALC
jgi:glucose-1-phosphate thymidylyltransferase